MLYPSSFTQYFSVWLQTNKTKQRACGGMNAGGNFPPVSVATEQETTPCQNTVEKERTCIRKPQTFLPYPNQKHSRKIRALWRGPWSATGGIPKDPLSGLQAHRSSGYRKACHARPAHWVAWTRLRPSRPQLSFSLALASNPGVSACALSPVFSEGTTALHRCAATTANLRQFQQTMDGISPMPTTKPEQPRTCTRLGRCCAQTAACGPCP